MSTKSDMGSTFHVVDGTGHRVYNAKVGELLGVWSHSKKLTYQVYALDFTVPRGDSYSITVSGALAAKSPRFAVGTPADLYPGLLLNTLFFYETQRDGPNFIRNALRDAPGHLKDRTATQYIAPNLDENDEINEIPPAAPLTPAGLPTINASGGWWDAGDYEKYVETMSYTVALMEIGIRDFPNQMGKGARLHPAPPPNAVSYAGDSTPGAPTSSDFREEARFGVRWLLRMWDSSNRRLAYQVDNTQDWNYYGEGDPSSAAGNCGGTYQTPFCLITEYDIWTLPQVADTYDQDGDPAPCDPDTTFYICNRPVFAEMSADHRISPNLAGRLAAAFALCYQVNYRESAELAINCLKAAQETYALANTSYPDPAPSVGSGSCATCLLTIAPFDGYPETVWDDDMEFGATELYQAMQLASEQNASRAAAKLYLKQAAEYAQRYINKIYSAGSSDTLNLYDVSGLAHFELHHALVESDDSDDLAVTGPQIKSQLLKQVDAAIDQSAADPWGFGVPWAAGDTTSHGAGLSVMASEAYSLTHDSRYDMYSQRWLANILGANAWGSSFIVGDGSTFPNCIQHQVANLAGALNGTAGGTPILWGAAVEGPSSQATSGTLDAMILCPANGVDTFRLFNGNSGALDTTETAVFRDNVQSYSTTEPAIDLTATSFLMWSWRLATHPE
jgi:endoglucanase